jgi:hypothetical protein
MEGSHYNVFLIEFNRLSCGGILTEEAYNLSLHD